MDLSLKEKLPKVPEGYFWSIRYVPTMGWHELQIRKKLWVGSSKKGWWAMRGTNSNPFDEDNILSWSRYALNTPEMRRVMGTYDSKTRQNLLGDYR